MAEQKPKRRIKKVETVRERATKSEKPKKRRIRQTVSNVSTGKLSLLRDFTQREYHPVRLPDNRVGRILTKRRKLLPKFFSDAWQELKLVTWPTRGETAKLTTAVIVFAFLFGGIVAIVDFGLEKFFRNFILN
jgi:preprotein translocase subunit SecE